MEQSPDSNEKEAVRKPDGGAVGRVLFGAGKLAGERPKVLVWETMAEKGGVGLEFRGEPGWWGRGSPGLGEEGTLLELLGEVTADRAV